MHGLCGEAACAAEFRSILAVISPRFDEIASVEFSRNIVETAYVVAEHHRARFFLLHVWDEEGYSVPPMGFRNGPIGQALDNVGEAVREKLADFLIEAGLHGLVDNVILARGDPASAISGSVIRHSVDLVVMSAVAYRGARGLFTGHVAKAVLRRTPCSLLALKPDGFVTPVVLDREKGQNTPKENFRPRPLVGRANDD